MYINDVEFTVHENRPRRKAFEPLLKREVSKFAIHIIRCLKLIISVITIAFVCGIIYGLIGGIF